MSDHKNALVPLASWCYASPDVAAIGNSVDLGLFAEALIYYDCLLINVQTQPQFADFLRWFARQEKTSDLISLISEGSIKVYEHSFVTAPIEKNGTYSIWNVQDVDQLRQDSFLDRYFGHPAVAEVFPKSKQRDILRRVLEGKVTEAKANDFGKPVENAREDFANPQRNALIVQAFVDQLYQIKGLGKPPNVDAVVTHSQDGTKHRITWNVNFDEISQLAGPKLNFHQGTPLAGGAVSNLLIWSAAINGCDLYLPKPMGVLVGDKLFESTERIVKTGCVIDGLKSEVEFPDIRQLVNSGQMGLKEILKIRSKAKRFRDWLQMEGDRDRNAIIAYHNEVAKEMGLIRGVRKAFSIFGPIGGGALGALIGGAFDGTAGGVIGGAAGGGIGYLSDVCSKISSGWKPVIFGDWLRDRIERVIRDTD